MTEVASGSIAIKGGLVGVELNGFGVAADSLGVVLVLEVLVALLLPGGGGILYVHAKVVYKRLGEESFKDGYSRMF